MGNDKKVLWILGLMHSGTTIVWRSFRRDHRFACLDEPFSGLGVMPHQNGRRSIDELISIFRKDERTFWEKYAPLHPLEELDARFTQEQLDYLLFLLSHGDRFVIDETHLHLHLEDLLRTCPKSSVIHLVRRAKNFVTSHLRPSWPKGNTLSRTLARSLRDRHNKAVFWSRQDLPPGLRRDDAIGRHPKSKFGIMLSDAGYDAERIMSSPAVVRLLAYWHYHYHYLETHGPKRLGDRFRTIWYEDFAKAPEEVMKEAYQWLGMDPPTDTRYDEVHAPKPPFKAEDERWRESARIAGFSEEELETLL